MAASLSFESPAGALPEAADCFISRLHLHEYVDDELALDVPGSAVREIILGHILYCPGCMRLEQQVRSMRVRLRELGDRLLQQADEQPSAEFRARIARLLAG